MTEVASAEHKGSVVAALMLAIGLAAIDATIVATAIPQIVGDIGGFSKFPWVFSIYLLTQAVTVPIYGRLSDVYGRKPILLFGIAGFLVGSVFCGLAWNMYALIAFRGLQGLAAGAILPTTTTIVGDLYEPAERGRIQGYISSVWGVSAIAGPTLGGVFAQYWTWRGIFFLNIPLGIAAAWLVHRHLHERVERREHRIDFAGVITLTLGLSLMILALLEGGVSWAWVSAPSIALFVVSAALLVAFVAIEQSVPEPILPLWVFQRRTLVAGNLASLAIGAIIIGQTSYVPIYAQKVVGVGAVVAGLAMGAMTIGWPLASTAAPRAYLKFGYKWTALIGSTFAVAGCLLFVFFVQHDSHVWRVAVSSFVIGIGMGWASVSTIVAIQSDVDWSERGVATGTTMFLRSLGSAVGIAVFGSIFNNSRSIYGGVHAVFLGLVVAAVLMLLSMLALPARE
ncbi:MAG TPA: MDR family MFS transporter [Gaiellaceae bacterium]|nr:MDR family MFS transporter [Gaiellaceae bacterium]